MVAVVTQPVCHCCGQSLSAAQLVKQAIERDGARSIYEIKGKLPIMLDEKEIYNALGYLTRKQMVKRRGRGQYEPKHKVGAIT